MQNNRAWFGVLPVLLSVAFSAVIPLMTVVNYSVQDILDINTRLFVGFEWYRETLGDPRLQDALSRQLLFSSLVILIEIPLGILVALALPREGKRLLGTRAGEARSLLTLRQGATELLAEGAGAWCAGSGATLRVTRHAVIPSGDSHAE